MVANRNVTATEMNTKLGGYIFRSNGGTFQVSLDNGTTWTSIAGTPGPAGTSIPKSGYSPIDQGLLTWSYDPVIQSSGSQPNAANSRLHGTRVWIPGPCTVNAVWLNVVTAGATPTSNNNKAVIYDASGNLLGTSVDQSTAWTSSGPKGCALATPVTVSAAGWFDIGFWSAMATLPAFGRGTGNTGMNAGVTDPANSRFWQADTGLTTSAPATLGVKIADTAAWWMAVSGTISSGFGAAFGL